MKRIVDFLKNEWGLIVCIVTAVVVGFFLVYVSGSNVDWLSLVSGILQIVTVAVALYSWYKLYSFQQNLKESEVTSGDNDLILVIDLTQKEIINDVVGFILSNKDDEKLGALNKLKEIESDKNNSNEKESSDTESKDTKPSEIIILERKYMQLNIYKDVNGIMHLVTRRDNNGNKQLMPFDDNELLYYVDDFKACVKKVKEIMCKSATTSKLHVFASAPTGLAAFVLYPFVNAKRVTWYAYNQNASDPAKKYYCMGEVKE